MSDKVLNEQQRAAMSAYLYGARSPVLADDENGLEEMPRTRDERLMALFIEGARIGECAGAFHMPREHVEQVIRDEISRRESTAYLEGAKYLRSQFDG